MKNKVIAGIVIAAAVIGGTYTCMSMTRVGQGEVGVVYSMKDGVKEETLNPGFHFVGPFDKVKDYPVAQQQLVLSNNPEDYNKDKHADWHVDAPADGGMVAMNLTINYNFLPDRVTGLYAKFNGMDGEDIVDNMVQNSIIAYIKEVTPRFSVMDIYSTKRAEVGKEITEYLNEKLESEYGIHVSNALIIDVQLDKTLKKKVQAKEQAKQDAEKAELDKKTAMAQAEVEKVTAQTEAEVQKIKAESAAERTKIKASAEAEANEMLSKSITPELIQMKEAEARMEHGWVTVQGADAVVKEGE
ncbi:MAG: SPFH domain-containing protein [Anaerobutyricum hallii]|uniref:SPFH domain-containing protein n=1 Tax=Anaerobutyricum hallii TaxID=39488 RepID=UPI002A81B2AB|nr:SPFH domain-containing protein [Anaerobutyricum hallii]MDY4579767.1 SPFH domain-containing protein [Anaerobutyricum hallii]